MRRIALTLVLLALLFLSWMPFPRLIQPPLAIVGAVAGYVGGSDTGVASGSSCVVPSYTPTTGNLLWIWVAQSTSNATAPTITDNLGAHETYTAFGSNPITNASGARMSQWYVNGVAQSGARTETITLPVTANKGCGLYEISGQSATPLDIDTSAVATSAVNALATTGTHTPAQASEIIVSAIYLTGSTTALNTVADGSTPVGVNNCTGTQSSCQSYHVINSTSSYNASWGSWTTARVGNISLGSFKSAAGPVTRVPSLMLTNVGDH